MSLCHYPLIFCYFSFFNKTHNRSEFRPSDPNNVVNWRKPLLIFPSFFSLFCDMKQKGHDRVVTNPFTNSAPPSFAFYFISTRPCDRASHKCCFMSQVKLELILWVTLFFKFFVWTSRRSCAANPLYGMPLGFSLFFCRWNGRWQPYITTRAVIVFVLIDRLRSPKRRNTAIICALFGVPIPLRPMRTSTGAWPPSTLRWLAPSSASLMPTPLWPRAAIFSPPSLRTRQHYISSAFFLRPTF